MEKNKDKIALKRSLSLGLLIFYGLGTILGAGVYALIGKVAKHAALFSPIAFLLAALISFFTVVSYAELSSRYPVSAGEAYYVRKGFNRKWLSALTGWLIIFTGLVSSAAIANGFAGYLQVFISIPSWLAIIAVILLIATVALWGITESAIMATVITLAEIGGLLLIVFICGDDLKKLPDVWPQMVPSFHINDWSGIAIGAFIAFYAYVGFEDIINVAEEVMAPKENLPLTLFIVLGIATVLYLLVDLSVILALPINALAQSEAPLALVVEQKGYSPILITGISLIALVNGILAQIIMASRVLYGMANQNNAPQIFASVSKTTRTPVIATLLIATIVIIFALCFPIETLAKATSFILLCVFILINLSLIRIKLRYGTQSGSASYSMFFPIMGVVLSFLFLIAQCL
ncbi:MAG: APC family permease [Candidatus Berkiella sp.]